MTNDLDAHAREVPAALRAPRRVPTSTPTCRLKLVPGAGELLLKLACVGSRDAKRCPPSTAVELLHRADGSRDGLALLLGEEYVHFHARPDRRDERLAARGLPVLRQHVQAARGGASTEETHRLVAKGASAILVVPSPLRDRVDGLLEELQRLERHLKDEGRDLAEVPLAFVWLQRPDAFLRQGDRPRSPPRALVPPEAFEALLNQGGRPSFVAGPDDPAGVVAAADAVVGLVIDDLVRNVLDRHLAPPPSGPTTPS